MVQVSSSYKIFDFSYMETQIMPILRVEMIAGRSPAQKSELAKSITESFLRICGGSPETVHVVFQDVSRENWAIAGDLLSAKT